MSRATSHTRLRLAGHVPDDPQRALDEARQAVIKANRLAAHAPGMPADFGTDVDANDPRWILAMQTQARLQGAVLTPERRDELMRSGGKLGLRPFEANLVMAVVQDRARRTAGSCSTSPLLRLAGHSHPEPRASESPSPPRQTAVAQAATWPQWLLAFAAAAALAAVMIRWLAN